MQRGRFWLVASPILKPLIPSHRLRAVDLLEQTMFDRITSDPRILGGKPIIRGTRISVEIVLEWIASGASRDDILQRHPHLNVADVEQALGYAAASMRNEVLVTAKVPDEAA